VLASQRQRRLVAFALCLGRQAPWDYQPQVDASQQYVRSSKTLDEIEAAARFPRPA
jgi:choline-sulfatase